jgi:uncharacterized protein YoxC
MQSRAHFVQEREADLRIEDLASDLKSKQTRLDQCLNELKDLQEQVDALQGDVDLRQKEMQRLRNETQKEIKYACEKVFDGMMMPCNTVVERATINFDTNTRKRFAN